MEIPKKMEILPKNGNSSKKWEILQKIEENEDSEVNNLPDK